MGDVKIQDVVVFADMGIRIDLEKGARIMDNAMYETEQFPDLIYRMAEPNVVILLFHSGKIVITGARSGKEVQDASEKLWTALRDNHLLMGVGENVQEIS